MHQVPNETMKHFPIPPSSMSVLPSANNPIVQDLLWISKQQQQHPSKHAHPLKNTIRINSRGIRFKFDGKQWRPLCQSADGYECRNLAFRSSLCQKHFYKVHLFKRPYAPKSSIPAQLPGIPPITLKRSLPSEYEHQHHYRHDDERQQSKEDNSINDELEETYEDDGDDDDDNSIEVIENHDALVSKQDSTHSHSEFSFFSIDCEPRSVTNIPVTNQVKSESSTTLYASRPEGLTKRSDSTNTESAISNESESSNLCTPTPKITESVRFSIPPLTRTEEKSLANELITQLPTDASFMIGEQMARRRVCEIVFDNYSQKLSLGNISSEWFYDFLLRNPRVPIHFQSWFSSIKSTLPVSDQLIDIKMWELGLVTRSFISSSSVSTSSSFSP